MRITFLGHASILVETRGVSILSDPWWNGPCFGAQWWPYPPPSLDALTDGRPDYVYISHGHHDHFHPTTLKLFDRSTTILIARDSDLEPSLRAMGFPVVTIADDAEYRLGGDVRCRIIRTHAADTLMTISDGQETCLNANDALHACPSHVQDHFLRLLRRHHAKIHYAFCGYGVASHFPNCYRIPGKDDVASAVHRQGYFNRAWTRIIHALAPNFAFPFAADVVFLTEDLFWSNEPIHNGERPTATLRRLHPHTATRAIDIAPGFTIEDGRVVVDRQRQPVSNAELERHYADAILRVRRVSTLDPTSFEQLLRLLHKNIHECHAYLSTFPRDYEALVRFPGAPKAIRIAKHGTSISVASVTEPVSVADYQLAFTTRPTYLRNSLTTPYGHEVLFVGSGGIFEYTSTSQVRDALHRELIVMMRPSSLCPPARPIGAAALLPATKRLVKRLFTVRRDDLYDLHAWTVRESSTRQMA